MFLLSPLVGLRQVSPHAHGQVAPAEFVRVSRASVVAAVRLPVVIVVSVVITAPALLELVKGGKAGVRTRKKR